MDKMVCRVYWDGEGLLDPLDSSGGAVGRHQGPPVDQTSICHRYRVHPSRWRPRHWERRITLRTPRSIASQCPIWQGWP